MIVEVIAVGTELLLGQIVNSNTSTMGAALAERGIDAHYQQTVGDNLTRIADAIRVALDRSDAIVMTGGIGPTQDDITREAVCEVTGREMVFSEDYADRLQEWWSRRGREMPPSNLRQAYYPAGAEMLPNPRGTAPGLVLEHEGKLIFCVPGVPAEMEHLMFAEVLPRLASASGEEQVIASRVIRTWGRPESEVAELLDDLYTSSVNPSLAFLASNSEIKVRVTAKAETGAEARLLIEPMEMEVRSRLGESVFGSDDETIERVLMQLLSDRGYTVGTAESMTGGMVSARLTDLPGSSAVVKGGLVAYDSELKRRLLGLSDVTEVVTSDAAVAMARGARTLLDVDVAIAVTGSAGPEPMEKPVGTVIVGVATPEDVRARELRFSGDRERLRTYGTAAALHLARLAIIGRWWKE
ncbi:MAG: competence/damage-inducible protein A [Acidimicrobiia bacterium]